MNINNSIYFLIKNPKIELFLKLRISTLIMPLNFPLLLFSSEINSKKVNDTILVVDNKIITLEAKLLSIQAFMEKSADVLQISPSIFRSTITLLQWIIIPLRRLITTFRAYKVINSKKNHRVFQHKLKEIFDVKNLQETIEISKHLDKFKSRLKEKKAHLRDLIKKELKLEYKELKLESIISKFEKILEIIESHLQKKNLFKKIFNRTKIYVQLYNLKDTEVISKKAIFLDSRLI